MASMEINRPSRYLVDFVEVSKSYCVGVVDVINSTHTAGTLTQTKLSKYYEIFLNSMAEVIEKFGGFVIKNIGDSLLYYFPESADPKRQFGFISCLECGLKLGEEHDSINKKLKSTKLPPLNYRISADYGQVSIMKTNYSESIDVLGTPVNMSNKINRCATPNRFVIGSDLHRMVKKIQDYKFKLVDSCSIGFKYMYPVYSVGRRF